MNSSLLLIRRIRYLLKRDKIFMLKRIRQHYDYEPEALGTMLLLLVE